MNENIKAEQQREIRQKDRVRAKERWRTSGENEIGRCADTFTIAK